MEAASPATAAAIMAIHDIRRPAVRTRQTTAPATKAGTIPHTYDAILPKRNMKANTPAEGQAWAVASTGVGRSATTLRAAKYNKNTHQPTGGPMIAKVNIINEKDTLALLLSLSSRQTRLSRSVVTSHLMAIHRRTVQPCVINIITYSRANKEPPRGAVQRSAKSAAEGMPPRSRDRCFWPEGDLRGGEAPLAGFRCAQRRTTLAP
jgi:hypothetical protein